MTDVTVTVSGPVGCGKSAIAGEIEIALKAIGVSVRYADPVAAQSEKNMTHADWQTAIELYKPSVVLIEQISRAQNAPAHLPSLREALKFIEDLSGEELEHARVGTGAEVALRHINRRAREVLA